MSSFICDKCFTKILDSQFGYHTGCIHYPEDKGARDKIVRYINRNIRKLLQDQTIPKEHVDWHNVRCYRVQDGIVYIIGVSPHSEEFKSALKNLIKNIVSIKDIKTDWIEIDSVEPEPVITEIVDELLQGCLQFVDECRFWGYECVYCGARVAEGEYKSYKEFKHNKDCPLMILLNMFVRELIEEGISYDN